MASFLNELCGDGFIELLVATPQIERKFEAVLENISKRVSRGFSHNHAVREAVLKLHESIQTMVVSYVHERDGFRVARHVYHACFNLMRQMHSSMPREQAMSFQEGGFLAQSGELAQFLLTGYIEEMYVPKHECSLKFADTMRQGLLMKMEQEDWCCKCARIRQ